jgi:hypothetical protein
MANIPSLLYNTSTPTLTSGSLEKAKKEYDKAAKSANVGSSFKNFVFTSGLFKDSPLIRQDFFCRFPNVLKADNYVKDYGYALKIVSVDKNNNEEEVVTMTFPINPQSINISIPTATVLTTTLRGIVEENNAAPLRHISLTGTSGVFPISVRTQSPTSSALSNEANYLQE